MPKGIRNQPESAVVNDAPRRLTITLRPADYDALAELAGEQYRTPELQGAWLIAKVLSEAGRAPAAPSPQALRILDHAAAKANGS